MDRRDTNCERVSACQREESVEKRYKPINVPTARFSSLLVITKNQK